LDWLLACAETAAEVEQDRARRENGGPSAATLPNGMREARVNYRELEVE
jgi:hypothetical protein